MLRSHFVLLLLLIVFGSLATAQKAKSRPATLAQQKMCSDQARKKFQEDYPNPSVSTSYTSHYDAKVNVCYIRVHEVGVANGAPSVSDTIYDAFEGREHGSYFWLNDKGKKYWEVAPFECYVKPLGEERISCSTAKEFEELAEKHFGLGM
jgi:hypothetical protein